MDVTYDTKQLATSKGKPIKPPTDAEPQISSAATSSTDEITESQPSDKYRRSGPQNDSPQVTAKAKTVPPWKQETPKSNKLRRKQIADKKAQSQKSRRVANEGKQLDIALVDLFAGLRTVHVASEGTRANFVLAHAPETCPFANQIDVKITLRSKCIQTCACWTINGQTPLLQKRYA